MPSFQGFRHNAASYAIAAGDSAEEVSWMLGHRHSGITRQVYIQEVKSAERRAQMRAKMEARYGSILGNAMEAPDGSSGQQSGTAAEAEVVELRQIPRLESG